MIGGLMKTTSRFALAAAAGLFVGAMAFTPAKAADLGGDCCADLEERVAELEATTVRKGNRVVSVELYGQVNKALLVWDDGIDSDAYIVDADYSSTRFGFRGSGQLKPGWTAGYRIEIQMESASSISVSQDEGSLGGTAFPGDDAGTDISVRRTSLYVESEQYGRVTMGKTSIATDDIVYTYLGSVNVLGAEFMGGGLRVRTSDPNPANTQGYFPGGAGITDFAGGLQLSDIATDTDIGRRDAVRYDSPSFYGFILSAGAGESDEWDVALRFKKEWNSIQVVAAGGYHEQDDVDKDEFVDQNRWIVSGGIKHTPSGIFLNGVYVEQETEDLGSSGNAFTQLAVANNRLDDDETATYYSIFGGIEGNYTGFGLSSFWLGFTAYEDFGVGTQVEDFDFGGATDDVMLNSQVDVYRIGVEQDFDSAALEAYIHFNYWEIDDFDFYEGLANVNDTTEGIEDVWTLVLGSRIKF